MNWNCAVGIVKVSWERKASSFVLENVIHTLKFVTNPATRDVGGSPDDDLWKLYIYHISAASFKMVSNFLYIHVMRMCDLIIRYIYIYVNTCHHTVTATTVVQ